MFWGELLDPELGSEEGPCNQVLCPQPGPGSSAMSCRERGSLWIQTLAGLNPPLAVLKHTLGLVGGELEGWGKLGSHLLAGERCPLALDGTAGQALASRMWSEFRGSWAHPSPPEFAHCTK